MPAAFRAGSTPRRLHDEGEAAIGASAVMITGIGRPGSTFCVAALNALQNLTVQAAPTER
jgi:hypothetical protein